MGAAVLAFLANVLGGLAPSLSARRAASLFRWAVGTRPVETGFHPAASLGLVAVAVAFVLAAGAVLRTRDLRGR